MPGVAVRLVAVTALCAAACVAEYPTHGGYPSKNARPWRKAVELVLDAKGEAEIDEVVSYPRQLRSRWFAVDLSSSGELDVELSATPLSDAGVDVAFEVLDEGYRMLVRADAEEDDAGDEEKQRTLYELPPGRYYVHVYLQERLDEADFTLHVAFRPTQVEAETGFPSTVAYIGQLAEVPKADDSPAPPPPKCKGSGCKKRPRPQPVAKGAMRARIAGIVTSKAGTTIKIDRGATEGVAVGWRGEVISRDGRPIPGGRFEVSRVSQRESYGTVKASSDAVTAAKYVRLQAP